MWKRLRNNNTAARSFILDNNSAQKYTPRNSVEAKKSPRKSLIFKRTVNKSQESMMKSFKTQKLDLLLDSKKDVTSVVDSNDSDNQDRTKFGSLILTEKECNQQTEQFQNSKPMNKRILRKQSFLNNPRSTQKSVKYCFFETSSINPSSAITQKQVQNIDKTVIQNLSTMSNCHEKQVDLECEAKKQMETIKERMKSLAFTYLQQVKRLDLAKRKYLDSKKKTKR